MKIYQLIYMLALMALTACNHSASVESKKTNAVLSSNEIHLGQFKVNTIKEMDLIITNQGEVPLNIYKVASSCGCTEVEWNHRPIKPHKAATLKVKYKDRYPGYIHKTVTIYANIEKPIEVKISGELVE